jgi:hypothetical protein
VLAAPVFLPADPAIPVGEVPVRPQITRALQADHEVLQRERKPDVPLWLWTAAGAVVLLLTAGLLGALSWGVGRLARATAEPTSGMSRRFVRGVGPREHAGATT